MLTKKQEDAFRVWLEALDSGEYLQTSHTLCERVDGDEKAYCCLGVLDEVVFGTEWHEYDGVLVDDEGEREMLDSNKASYLDLDLYITENELDYFADKGIVVDVDAQRITTLATLNDEGYTFEDIVDVIEELGWNG